MNQKTNNGIRLPYVVGSIYNKEQLTNVKEVTNISKTSRHFRNIGKIAFKIFCQKCEDAEMTLCQTRKNDRNGIIS